MAVATQTLLSLEQALSEALNDFLEVDTTTNIAANTSIISTSLKVYDDAADDHFNNWWVYITEGNNIGVLRKISDYATSTGTITVYGANLAAEAGAVTIRVGRFNRTFKTNAIIQACKDIYPSLHVRLDDQTLITGNIIPDGSFESWSSTSALTWFSTSNITLARTSTAGLLRNGAYSAKATASADNGYIYISSDSYPRLLDLQGQSVDFYSWAYPEVANDGYIVIYTIQADGTAQTLTSTTTCAAGAFTELKLESQTLNDDLEEIQLRWKVATNTKYVYFDDAMIQGRNIYEYLLPDKFRDGHLSNVTIQTHSDSDQACYDLSPFTTMHPGMSLDRKDWDIADFGSQRYLKTDALSNERRLRLEGMKPLETLSADTDTITLDAEKVSLLIAKAEVIFYERYMLPVSSDDIIRYNFAHGTARNRFRELLNLHRMPRMRE